MQKLRKRGTTCSFPFISLAWLLIKYTDKFYIYISFNFPCGQMITEGRNERSEKKLEVGISPERRASLFIQETKLFTRCRKILRCNWISRSIHRTWGFAISFRSVLSLSHSLLPCGHTHTHTHTHTQAHSLAAFSILYYAVVTRLLFCLWFIQIFILQVLHVSN
jgi:hypothetical protein